MFTIIGAVIVLASVIGGYIANGGHLEVLFQPFEMMIIVGAAAGAFVIANRKPVLSAAAKAVPGLIKPEKYDKAAFLELLTMLYSVFKLAKSKGALVLEQHVENPEESTLFQRFPIFLGDHHAVVFLCDYLRLLTLGTDNHHEMETLMDEDLETHRAEHHAVSSAINTTAEGLPALGIVAAVLGVIHTMGSITEPPAVLGHLIAGALVGTIFGKLLEGRKLLELFALLMLVIAVLMLRTRAREGLPDVRISRDNMPAILGLGLATGVLSGFFGIGGGFLIVPALMLATGMPIMNAVSSSLVAVTAFGLSTAASYAWSGLISWELAGLFIAGGFAGGLIGTRLARSLAAQRGALNIVFATIIILVALYMLTRNLFAF